ncbi:uncharacterized protein [Eurosta solidaginis]|uniref:uncharacterized protein isoform X2 n=1 Tax=Eurosta solidaginis TaxID=178769 RepID=UPI0035305B37
MKFNACLALIVICGLVACSQALPAQRLTYYQQPAAAPYYAAPQHMMFMRYVQPSYGHAGSQQAATTLVAGDSVATGTYVQGADGDVSAATGEVQDDSVASATSHVAHSVAEAYPAAVPSAEEEQKVPVQLDLEPASSAEASDNNAKEGRDYNYDTPADVAEVAGATGDAAATDVEIPEPVGAETGSATVAVGLSGTAELEEPAPAPTPIAPITPAKRNLPATKKKVIVELEQAAAEDTENVISTQDDDEDVLDENDDAYAPVPIAPKVPAARRPAAKKPSKAGSNQQKPQPVGTYFPVDFGGATGGAIAIANSFSTGESGSATSHAIAYGNPDQARAHVRPSRRH